MLRHVVSFIHDSDRCNDGMLFTVLYCAASIVSTSKEPMMVVCDGEQVVSLNLEKMERTVYNVGIYDRIGRVRQELKVSCDSGF